MVHVRNFCIDRYEGYLVTVTPDGKTVDHPYSERPEPGVAYRARNARGHMPQAFINRYEARRACENAGKRLCRLREWYAACQGPRHTVFPYGNRYEKGRCNQAKPHLLSKLYGREPRRWTYRAFNDPKLATTPGFLAPSGQYGRCTNDYGVFDMVGNLHEWVSDSVDASLVNKIPLRDDIRDKIEKDTGHGIFMGGFFSTTSEHGKGCRFLTPGHGPKYHDYSTGFRCCKDVAETRR